MWRGWTVACRVVCVDVNRSMIYQSKREKESHTATHGQGEKEDPRTVTVVLCTYVCMYKQSAAPQHARVYRARTTRRHARTQTQAQKTEEEDATRGARRGEPAGRGRLGRGPWSVGCGAVRYAVGQGRAFLHPFPPPSSHPRSGRPLPPPPRRYFSRSQTVYNTKGTRAQTHKNSRRGVCVFWRLRI